MGVFSKARNTAKKANKKAKKIGDKIAYVFIPQLGMVEAEFAKKIKKSKVKAKKKK